MPDIDISEFGDPAEEILVHAEPTFVLKADQPAIDEPPIIKSDLD